MLRQHRDKVTLLVAGALLVITSAAAAQQRTWNFITSGNGHGFQVYDINSKKIVSFLEHPYRYVRPRPDPKSDGFGRRNLAFDFYFGVRGGGGSAFLNQGTASGDPGYVEETNIIRAPLTAAGIASESYFFAPFGYEGNAMIAVLKAPGASSAFALFNFHMGTASNPDSPGVDNESVRWIDADKAMVETGPGGGALVYVALSGVDLTDCNNGYNKVVGGQDLGNGKSCNGNDIVPVFQQKNPADGMMAVAIQYVENANDADQAVKDLRAWQGGRAPQKILDDARAEWDAWRKPIPAGVNLSDKERKLWRQSEAVLRMGQVREKYTSTRKNHGMVLASLPPGEWHSGWTRDAMYGIVALARSGHHEEAKKAVDFFLAAGPVGKYKSYVSNVDYQISVVRYFGTGEEEADYSGQPTPNIETDGWGMYLWTVRQYLDASANSDWLKGTTPSGMTAYDMIVQKVANPLEANLESNGIVKADSSIWEVHDANKRHFAYTTLAAARGFCDLASIAQRAGKPDDVAKYQALAAKVRNGFFASFLDQQGAIGGSVEELSQGNYIDAAVVEAFTWNIVDLASQQKTATATLDKLGMLRVASGGFKRNDDSLSSYDNNEWIMIDLRMADAMRRAGRATEADNVVSLVVDKAAVNFNLLPELYNAIQQDGQIGKYAGSIPMVGYGGGAFILTMLDRAGQYEPSDCGTSFITDGGVVVQPDLSGFNPGGGDGGFNPGGAPYTTACFCSLGARAETAGGVLVAVVWILVGAGLVRGHVRNRNRNRNRQF